MTKYDFVEIGTSMFDTEIEKESALQTEGKPTRRGLSVEPMSIYLDKLPDVSTVTKVNCAVGYERGQFEIFYLDPALIERHFPGKENQWLYGVNSISKPQVELELFVSNHSKQIPELKISSKLVEVVTFEELARKWQISEIGYLKIDTEGMDLKILASMLNYWWALGDNADSRNALFKLPRLIRFERNHSSVKLGYLNLLMCDLVNIVYVLFTVGYRIVENDLMSNDLVVAL